MAESTLLSRNCDIGNSARTIGATTIPDLLRSNGYVIFDRLLPADTVERICEELEPSLAATECSQAGLSGRSTRMGSVLQKSPSSRAVAVHPIMLCVANAILAANCEFFQLCLTQEVRLYPGHRQRAPHRDDDGWQANRRGMEHLVNVIWGLSDFTKNNGAPLLWPRSHFSQSSSDLDPVKAVVAEIPRGSALVYLGSIMHSCGANRSREPLTGLHFRYCLGWLNQYDKLSDSYPADVARQFPETLRELLGIYNQGTPPRGSGDQDPCPLFHTDSRTLLPTHVARTGIARELDVSRAGAQCDTVAGPRTKQ